jgi:hypothetical protein
MSDSYISWLGEIKMVKYLCLLLMLLMASGCCQLFGLCTSVKVHTSSDSPDKIAGADAHGCLIASAMPAVQASPQLRPD